MSERESPKFEDDITAADLYPNLSPEEQREAEFRLLRYLAIVRRIFERIVQEGNSSLLTELERRVMLRKERQKDK